MWMQVCLGLHSLVGVALVVVTIPVFYGFHDLLAPKRPGVGVLFAGLGWLLVGWLLVRVRPMPERRLQPEARFTAIPAALVAAMNLIVGVLFMFPSLKSREFLGFVLLSDLAFFAWGPLSAVTWAVARIRYHVGTWVLAWAMSFACLFLWLLLSAPLWMAD